MENLICTVDEKVYRAILVGEPILYTNPDTQATSQEIISDVHQVPKTNTLQITTQSGKVFPINSKQNYIWPVTSKSDIPAANTKRNKPEKRKK